MVVELLVFIQHIKHASSMTCFFTHVTALGETKKCGNTCLQNQIEDQIKLDETGSNHFAPQTAALLKHLFSEFIEPLGGDRWKLLTCTCHLDMNATGSLSLYVPAVTWRPETCI